MKKITVLILTLCLLFSALPTFAEGDVTTYVSYDSERGSITVSGEAIGRGSVMMVTSGSSLSSLGAENKPIFIKPIIADGDYSIDILLPEGIESGKYDVYFTTSAGSAFDSFSYINLKKAADALHILEGAKDEKEYEKIAEENAKDLGIDMEDEAYNDNKEEIYTLLYNFNTDYEDPSKFNTNYHKMYALSVIMGGDREKIESTLNKFQSQLMIDFIKDYAEDERIGEEEKEYLCSLLSDADFEEEFKERENTDFKEIFEELKSVSAVSCAKVWQDIKTAIEEEFENLKYLLDNKTYKKVKDKNEVYSKLMKKYKSFTSLKEFEDAFYDCVQQVYKSENKSTSSGGSTSGSSGGGFSGGGAAVTTPSVMEEKFPLAFKLTFTDFGSGHWSYDAVYYLAEKGIISGYADNTFRADNFITRAEFTKLIISAEKIFGIEISEKENVIFSDVNEGDWYFGAVMRAAKGGIIFGRGDSFAPHDNITRQDAAVIIHRYLCGKKEVSGNKIFADRGKISDYAKEAVAALGAKKIINGTGENAFMPQNNLTRAQAAQLIFSAINYAQEGENNEN